MKSWKIVLGVLGLLIVAAIGISVYQDHRDQDEDEQIYLERRHDYVRTMGKSLPGGTMSLAGANEDILVLDYDGCGPNTLQTFLGIDKIVVPMMEAHFTKLRCRDSGIEVTVPRQP